jgi:Flp pilus assembly protein TadG
MLRRRLAQDESGLAAVEFALILPVMLVMFFGIFETSQALTARADVVNVTSAAADLVAQESAATTDDIGNVYNAANAMLYPFPITGAQKPSIRITSIVDDGLGVKDPVTSVTPPHSTGNVAWTCAQTGGVALDLPGIPAPSVGASVPLGQPIMGVGSSVIRVEVGYLYKSPTTQSITGPIAMKNVFYTKPRRALQITAPTGSCNG